MRLVDHVSGVEAFSLAQFSIDQFIEHEEQPERID